MVLKQSFYCDTEDCMHYCMKERECGKGSIAIQEGRCCDHEKMFIERVNPEAAVACVEARQKNLDKSKREREERKEASRLRDEQEVLTKNTVAVNTLIEAVSVLRSSGTICGDEITLYRDLYNYKVYASIFNLLFYIYGLDVPINVRGWINKWLHSIRVEDAVLKECSRNRKHPSATYLGYLNDLINVVRDDKDNAVLYNWLVEKGIPYLGANDQAVFGKIKVVDKHNQAAA